MSLNQEPTVVHTNLPKVGVSTRIQTPVRTTARYNDAMLDGEMHDPTSHARVNSSAWGNYAPAGKEFRRADPDPFPTTETRVLTRELLRRLGNVNVVYVNVQKLKNVVQPTAYTTLVHDAIVANTIGDPYREPLHPPNTRCLSSATGFQYWLSYGLGSIPSVTGRLYCQDVAQRATNRSRGSEMQNLSRRIGPYSARAKLHQWINDGHGATAMTHAVILMHILWDDRHEKRLLGQLGWLLLEVRRTL
ncbi:hypothetical protein QBC36DRAFT_380583 [Triangularia setosa]|uniref:Uncharacterized protein n=1 Tax=Triangularia setosa TaxID=2587417 RepID=A0AAN6W245_9PEZI|nr:hypothetical protein QBC36DRAFT_380583 [Podospora setosa]